LIDSSMQDALCTVSARHHLRIGLKCSTSMQFLDPRWKIFAFNDLHDDARAGLIDATAVAALGAFGGGNGQDFDDGGLHCWGLVQIKNKNDVLLRLAPCVY